MAIYLSTNRPLRLTTLSVLYISQGVPDGFVRTGLKTYLTAQGTSAAEIGSLIALTSWPWAIKWLWGPILDSFSRSNMGRRRPWILAAQFGMGLTMAAISMLPDISNNLRLLGFAILVINCFSSLQDVAIDALAIDVLHTRERGVANGLMFGASYVGSFLGGAVVGGCLLRDGLRQAVLIEILILTLIATFPFLFRERPGDRLLPSPSPNRMAADDSIDDKSIGRTLRHLLQAFGKRESTLAALLAVSSLVSTSAFSVLWPIHMVRELNWTSENVLALEGGYAILAGLVGSLLGGVLASTIGAKRTSIITLASFMLCWVVFAATSASWQQKELVTVLFLAIGFLASVFQVSMFALFMGVCAPAVAATQFSAYMALLNISTGIGAQVAGHAYERTSLFSVFVVMAALQLAMIIIVSLMRDQSGKVPEGDLV
jgi:PAT family beta-lactamase induction signal transducer AmpG